MWKFRQKLSTNKKTKQTKKTTGSIFDVEISDLILSHTAPPPAVEERQTSIDHFLS